MSILSWLFGRKKAPVCEVPVPPKVEPVEPAPAPAPPPAPVPVPPAVPPLSQGDIHYPYRPIFNLLGKSEGTDRKRGYNETLGYGAFTGGDVVLTAMTLAQIDALQTKMLKHPANKLNSSALGRYQIVRTTLRKIKKAMGLGDKNHFNEKLQDHLCLYLLEVRGLSRYLDGKLSEDQFMTNMAMEWASIPKPNGRGYYGNQANTPVTPSEVRTVLAEVKRRIKE